MNPPTISDIVTEAELWNSLGIADAATAINARHRERMAEVIKELDDLKFALACQAPWDAKAQGLLDAGRWAGHTCIEGCVTELEETRAYRDQLQSDLNTRASERDAARAEIERLKLDIGILNGRLIERTQTMLARQRESLDEARKARSVASKALDLLGHIIEVFRNAADDRRVQISERRSYGAAASRLENAVTPLRDELNAANCGNPAEIILPQQ